MSLAEIIESECLRLGVIKESLTVLTEECDPYRQSTEKFHTMGRWFAEQVERDFAGRASHIRGIHYAIVARGDIMRPDGTPYINNAECWEWLLKAAPAARWLGYLGFDRIIDGRNSDPVLITREDLAELDPNNRRRIRGRDPERKRDRCQYQWRSRPVRRPPALSDRLFRRKGELRRSADAAGSALQGGSLLEHR